MSDLVLIAWREMLPALYVCMLRNVGQLQRKRSLKPHTAR